TNGGFQALPFILEYPSAAATYAELEMLVDKVSSGTGHLGAWEAVHFLVEQGVLIQETKKVSLRNLFGYEKGIAECLRGLVEGDPWNIHLDTKGECPKSKADAEAENGIVQEVKVEQMDLAFPQPGTSSTVHHNGETTTCEITKLTIKEENDFDIDPATIELDEDQVRAAEMMCANPVTVISGKGGCGKTTVVSLVFKAAMEQQTSDRKEVLQACEVFQNDSQGKRKKIAKRVTVMKSLLKESCFTSYQENWFYCLYYAPGI
ncbi:hypothetical protein M9458_009711, partial [Cirrhinus mrigala]